MIASVGPLIWPKPRGPRQSLQGTQIPYLPLPSYGESVRFLITVCAINARRAVTDRKRRLPPPGCSLPGRVIKRFPRVAEIILQLYIIIAFIVFIVIVITRNTGIAAAAARSSCFDRSRLPTNT